jgi:transcription elongation factor GreA
MAADDVVHITAQGRERLEAELRDLVENRRAAIVRRVATARAEGDLSENFAYHDARRELGVLDGRVLTIEAQLRHAQVMETTVGDVVGLGSTVTIHDEFGESTYVIVGPVEADVAGGRISMVSPLGAALMGRTVGDEVAFSSPGGTRSASVVEVR